MSNRKPLVLGDDSGLQQLQPQDELDVPLEDRFRELDRKFRALLLFMMDQGFDGIIETFPLDIEIAQDERK